MRRVLATLVFLFLLGAALAGQATWVGIVEKAAPSVVRIQITSDEEKGWCSGVIVAPDIVLTAAHCVPTKPEGRSLAANKRHAEIVRVNYALDLALLKVEGLDGKPMPRRTAKVVPGVPVALVGFSGGEPEPFYRFGYVSRVSPTELVSGGTFFDTEILHGDSGGALCDQDGRLITMAHVGVTSLGTLAVGVAPETVEEFARPYWPKSAPAATR